MKKLSLVALMLFTTHLIYSQQTIPVSGGLATGSGGTSSYSLGQLIYTTITDSGGTLTQGVQQSFDLESLSNPELTTLNLTAVMYPNPTSGYIVLELKKMELIGLSYAMYDIQGREVSKGQVHLETTQIVMQGLAMGIYILKVNQNNQAIKTFKIIKN